MLQIALSETLMKILTSFFLPLFFFFLIEIEANPFKRATNFFLGKNYYTTKFGDANDPLNKICINTTNRTEFEQRFALPFWLPSKWHVFAAHRWITLFPPPPPPLQKKIIRKEKLERESSTVSRWTNEIHKTRNKPSIIKEEADAQSGSNIQQHTKFPSL